MLHIPVRECQPLSELDNGQITPPICNTKPLHGQTCDYECASGYKVNGHNSNECDNGHWKYAQSTCEGKILLFVVRRVMYSISTKYIPLRPYVAHSGRNL